jgi:anti-sigma-K factor RskA
MSDHSTPPPEEREPLAAALALGVLSGPALAAAERLEASDAVFRAQVEDWRRRLAPLALAIAPVTPPSALWTLIEARLPGAGVAGEAPRLVEQLRRRLRLWRTAAAGFAVAAVALAVLVAVPGLLRPPPPQRFVAVLGEGAQSPQFLVTVDLEQQQVSIMPVAEIGQPQGDFELWLIAGQDAPQSLGLVSPSDGRRLALGALAQPALLAGGLLAISLEPAGGSPTGAPTGPVLWSGKLLQAPQ